MNIITKIEVTKRNNERVNVYIDNEFAFAVSAEIIYKEGIKVNDSINIERISEIAKEDNYLKCKATAFKIVERAFKTEKEIYDKLALKGYDKDTIIKTIYILKEYNYINDDSYVKMYIKDKSKTQGTEKIKYTLLRKGIKEELILEELEKLECDYVKEVALKLAEKKYSILLKRENDKYKLHQKLYTFLLGKGYSYNIISEVVKEIINGEIY